MKVTEQTELNDPNLLRELKRRLKEGRFDFIFADPLKQVIVALKTRKARKGRVLQAEDVELLWQLLIEDAITYLKMSDSREWREKFGTPGAKEQRSSLKAFGVEKLKDYFAQFMEFEKVLYGAVRYYHEHTLHVFRVWMLGALLLDDWSQDNNYPHIEFFNDLIFPILDPISDEQKNKLIKFHEIQAMWCIIALSHDLGYPLQKVDDINNETRAMLRNYAKVNLQDLNFNVPQQHHFINDFILRFISSRTIILKENKFTKELLLKIIEGKKKLTDQQKRRFRTHVQSKYYLKYSKSLEDFEHGIFSSILLMRSLTYFLESDFDLDELKPLEYDDARQCSIRREILRAIAAHTCEQIYHIRPDTLSFLLILCDELQSWGRPTIQEILGSDDSESPISKLVTYREQEVEFELVFPDINKAVYNRTAKLFQRFHKLLRVAVGAPQREFKCKFTVKTKSTPDKTFVFKFVSMKEEPPEFEFTSNDIEWRPWDEEYENWEQKRKTATKNP
jgi:hypothetical protein